MRLLLVEDDERLSEHMLEALEEDLHTVDLVSDGALALEYVDLLLEEVFDVVILDVVLPGKDGLEVCGEWRRAGVQTPVIMLTARRNIEDRVLGLDAGADDYLTKPFALSELLARIRALGRRKSPPHADVLSFDDLSLNPATHRVERGSRLLHLTPREYRILELFLRNPGQVLTRDQIGDRAWDLGSEHASNVVDVFVHTLRRKVDGDETEKLIHTVRGTGYVLRKGREAAASPNASAESLPRR